MKKSFFFNTKNLKEQNEASVGFLVILHHSSFAKVLCCYSMYAAHLLSKVTPLKCELICKIHWQQASVTHTIRPMHKHTLNLTTTDINLQSAQTSGTRWMCSHRCATWYNSQSVARALKETRHNCVVPRTGQNIPTGTTLIWCKFGYNVLWM